MQLEGKLKVIDETKDIGSSGFQKRDCVVTTDEQYPQHILVQFVQDKCNLLSSFKVGDNVKIDINLKGREWVNPKGETIYFNTIQGWKIANVQPAYNANFPPPINDIQPKTNSTQNGGPLPGEDEPDDLPF